jgi:uncharacterized membrane protein YphA (DoxX/SURF4 family)
LFKTYLVFECRIVLGLSLAAAALGKLSSLSSTTQLIRAHFVGLLPRLPSTFVVGGLSVLEIALGATILTGLRIQIAGAAVAVLLLFLSLASVHAAVRGRVGNCGCFGDSMIRDSVPSSLARSAILLAAALILASLHEDTALSLDGLFAHVEGLSPQPPELAPALLVGAAFAGALMLLSPILAAVNVVRGVWQEVRT